MITSACSILLLSDIAQAQSDRPSEEELVQALQKVRTTISLTARTNAAEHVAPLTRRMDPQNVSDTTVGGLVSLLNTNEDSVRAWVAASLGNLGPRAKAAVPALLKLLPEVDCLRGSLTSAPFIRLALERIGETPPPRPKCTGKD